MNPYLQDADLTLYQGDALEVLRGLPDESVHCCVTSPPYLDARPEYPSPSLEVFNAIFGELRRVVTGPLLLNVGRIFRGRSERLWWTNLLEQAGLQDWHLLDTLVWVKPNANPIHGNFLANSHEYVFILGDPSLNGTMLNIDAVRRPHAPSTVARFDRAWTNHRGVKNPRESRARKSRAVPNPAGALPRSYVEICVGAEKGNPHPAPMAPELASHLVLLASREGEVVLDPFAGSGTTGLVARKHGRRSILIELSSEYCELVSGRTQQLSLEAEPA